MNAKYVQRGDSIDYTPSGDVNAGDVVVIGPDLIGIAKLDIKAGKLGALALTGVFQVPKNTGEDTAFAAGMKVYWNTTDKVVTDDDSDPFLGKSITAAANSDENVLVRLNQ
jgi:predicted RecA/RadA family phage recombinase